MVTTETRTFEKDREANDRLVAFLEQRLPGYTGPELYTKSCLYTMPPDRNFTIDFVPGEPRIVVAQGAAHAYKFAALIGKILVPEVVANVELGGPKRNRLYICATTSLFAIYVNTTAARR